MESDSTALLTLKPMQPTPIRTHAAVLAGAGLLSCHRLLLRVGLLRPIDGWRRATGLVLRGGCSTFVLSAFGLDAWSDGERPTATSTGDSQAHAAARLHRFLAAEPACHIRIRRGEREDRAETSSGPRYTIAFQPWVDGPRRFLSPDDWSGVDASGMPDPTAAPLFNAVCRVDSDGTTDVWLRINHVGADGVPIQELLSRLEAARGARHPVVYPTPSEFAPYELPRPCNGRPDLAEVQTFVDFAPLLAWRKRAQASLAEPMTLAATVLWCLGSHEAFSGLYTGTTVEVQATRGLERGVGVMVVRPADYARDSKGLAAYVRDFNRQVERTRRRESPSCRILDAAAHVPPGPAAALLRHALARTPRAFGSMALTMLKDAKVFGGPIADTGHARGFFAIGSVALPSRDGRKVGCVTVKGPAAVVARYPAAIRAVVDRCGDEAS